ncbi:signal transduction histidine kinase [Bacillus pakistanensis]|uniref:histidine kinase n=1 Tax=Rossellomorea pakistanensis TaxID=992288 RepID=A0ABS2N6X3_9BACI|nr:GAF domain-containing sensor histidine kinase [Bacillus pakistanensis]MBM7583610.1 signal transduction histidine kinase [Bacillus pakistanensis]
MSDWAFIQKREKNSRHFLFIISFLGWVTLIVSLIGMDIPQEPIILCLLTVFLFISEYFPMPVWKGFTTITFPLVYVLYLLYGLPYALLTFALSVLIINIIERRPWRIVFFNPAQLVLSFFLAHILFSLVRPIIEPALGNAIIYGITEYILLLVMYLVINNTIVDIVLWIRPQPYPFKLWKQKTFTECLSAIISIVYGLLLYLLGSQNRGEVDAFSYFFFFSPLVGFALLCSMIMKLKKEKRRLKALFTITNELNQMLPTKEWSSKLKESFNDFMNVDASILWMKENGNWQIEIKGGRVNTDGKLTAEMINGLEDMKKPVMINNRKKRKSIAETLFESDIKSLVYSPLVIENETVGMFIVGRSRTKSFEDDDVQSIATLSNQLAVIIKTKMLFNEKEKRKILEERNRIARDIHDGLAQNLAGAVMKLETAGKKFSKNPDETIKLVNDSIWRLRGSLKEVRESIYALRPYPTQKIGVTTAISKKIETIKQEHHVNIGFEIRGKEVELSPMVEKVLYDTLQESLQNIIKHANATKVDVLASYQTEHVLLKIKDDGKGFSLFKAMLNAQSKPHFGILQMNDGAEKIQATLQIDSKEGEGTEVSIIVPKMGFEGGEIIDQTNLSG